MTAAVTELAVLAALSAERGRQDLATLVDRLQTAGLEASTVLPTIERMLAAELVRRIDATLEITEIGSMRLVESCAAIEQALDNSPSAPEQEECPSVPWLTTVQTEWIEAVSINYAVDPSRLAPLIPAPLEVEIFRGSAWVQVLMSSLRDLRPQGLGSLFGVNFYQLSYRAAVRYRSVSGVERRGGYFVRSETNHAVMRAVGNALAEFEFHRFGAADMLMVRDGPRLTVGVDAHGPEGRIVGTFDTTPIDPPATSAWESLEALQHPLVECYDAYGVDPEAAWLYTLTIDRDPWNARFVTPIELYCEYFETGPLGGGAARFDSVLHIPRCRYRWRPLRRERYEPDGRVGSA